MLGLEEVAFFYRSPPRGRRGAQEGHFLLRRRARRGHGRGVGGVEVVEVEALGQMLLSAVIITHMNTTLLPRPALESLVCSRPLLAELPFGGEGTCDSLERLPREARGCVKEVGVSPTLRCVASLEACSIDVLGSSWAGAGAVSWVDGWCLTLSGR